MTTARVEKPEAAPEPTRPRLKAKLCHMDGEGWLVTTFYTNFPDEWIKQDGYRIVTIPPDAEQAAHDEYVRRLEAAYACLDRSLPQLLGPMDMGRAASEVCIAVRTAKAALDAERSK